MDLSKYVGKTINVELGDGIKVYGELLTSTSNKYPYWFKDHCYTKEGLGLNGPNIIRIISGEDHFTGIAQRAPHINLDDFVGQKVYVKLTNGSDHFTSVKNLPDEYHLADLSNYHQNGENSIGFPSLDIAEIYGEGAYKVITKPTFDDPDNPTRIDQAKQLLSQMSEEEIARLLKSL
jgi:small nuclear ribonucleoprotein (snRNP)-like protein